MKPITFTTTPTLLWSPPGCGKTQLVLELARETFSISYDAAMKQYNPPEWARKIMDAHRPQVERILEAGCYTLLSSTFDPVDMGGVLVPTHGASVRMLPLYWIVAAHIPIAIFVDELTTGTPEQQAMSLRITDDSRELDGLALHKDSRVIGAANPPEFAAGSARELSAPALSRWRHRTIGAEYAVEWMQNQPHKFTLLTGLYFRSNPAAALATPETITKAVEEQKPFANPRSWTRAAVEVMEHDIGALPEYIGTHESAAFINYLENIDLPDPKEIYSGRCMTVPARGDAAMATAAAIRVFMGIDTNGRLKDKPPTDAGLENVAKWFFESANCGHVANVFPDYRMIFKGVGEARMSRYGKLIAPFGELLVSAGMIKL